MYLYARQYSYRMAILIFWAMIHVEEYEHKLWKKITKHLFNKTISKKLINICMKINIALHL